MPFNIARTWHLQLAIFWVSTSFLAAGIFLAPMITGREPRRQNWLSFGLLGALAIVVFGSLAGEYAGISGWIQRGWSWFGAQGFEYLDLGRFWQILLTVGLVFWVIILFRGLRGRLGSEHVGNMPWLFFFSALSIPAFYAVGLLARTDSHFTTTDFWRFWVVHLWVEDFLELFTTIMVAYIFVLLGVVHERVALKVIYLDILLYSAGGVVGTMHHVYFSGEPSIHMALGAFFSAAEVIPLTFLTLEAWSFLQLGAQQSTDSRTPFPHFWAVMFLASVGFWNFLGAGIFGFLINLPDRFLLRDRDRPDGEPRARGDDGCLWDAGRGIGAVLPAIHDSRKTMERPRGQDQFLVAEHRAGLDGLCHAIPAGHRATLSLGQRRIFRRALP